MRIFICLTFILLSLLGASAKVLNNNVVDSKCLATEKDCGNGCCPYSNGTCCTETQTCCQHGETCIGPLSICLGLKSDDNTGGSLYSEQAVRLRDVTNCPSGYTSCYDSCCPSPNAVCCSDRQTCCPSGYHCAPGYCVKNGMDRKTSLKEVRLHPFSEKKSVFRKQLYSTKSMEMLNSVQTVPLRGVTRCSSGEIECYDECCKDGETCCDAFFEGYECCASYEVCTHLGCFHK